MVIIVGFYTASHGKFHDIGYADILYGINSIDIMGWCTQSRGNYHVLLLEVGESSLVMILFIKIHYKFNIVVLFAIEDYFLLMLLVHVQTSAYCGRLYEKSDNKSIKLFTKKSIRAFGGFCFLQNTKNKDWIWSLMSILIRIYNYAGINAKRDITAIARSRT